MSSKRSTTAARWGRYPLAGALLAVLVASGISAQLFATTDAAQSSSIEDADPTLYAHGHRLRPLVEATNGAQTLNIYGPGGHIIAQATRNDQGSEASRYPLADHLGSTRAALDADDNVVAHFEYGPHGEPAESGVAAAEARYRYTGHAYDEEQGVYQTPNRGYDPATGRFLSVDPQRHDASPYVYAGNNPVGLVDPTGGGETPFFMRSGFWGQNEEEGFTSVGLAKGYVRSTLGILRDIGARLGKHEGHNIQDATRVFGSDPYSLPKSVSQAPGFLTGFTDRDFRFNSHLYWFIGDDKKLELPAHFSEAVRSIRAVSRWNFVSSEYASPNFAENITLVDFTRPDSDAISKVSEFLSGGGFRYHIIRASEIPQFPVPQPPDNLQIPEPQEMLDEMFPMEQQGPDAQGGAGPPPPPTSIDGATGQPTRQPQDNLQIPEQPRNDLTMQEETGFGFTSEQISAINAIPNLDSYVGVGD